MYCGVLFKRLPHYGACLKPRAGGTGPEDSGAVQGGFCKKMRRLSRLRTIKPMQRHQHFTQRRIVEAVVALALAGFAGDKFGAA